jgi:hypothetical protein
MKRSICIRDIATVKTQDRLPTRLLMTAAGTFFLATRSIF